MAGKEIPYKLRANERFRNLPIAIYPTSNLERDTDDTLGLGANIYTVKPDDFQNLEKILQVQWRYVASSRDI